MLIKVRVFSDATLFDFTDSIINIHFYISVPLKVFLVVASQPRISLIYAASLYSTKPKQNMPYSLHAV